MSFGSGDWLVVYCVNTQSRVPPNPFLNLIFKFSFWIKHGSSFLTQTAVESLQDIPLKNELLVEIEAESDTENAKP